jgi:hypothetical protein
VLASVVQMLFRNDYAPPNGLENVVAAEYTGPLLISNPSSPLKPDFLSNLNMHFMQFLEHYQPGM